MGEELVRTASPLFLWGGGRMMAEDPKRNDEEEKAARRIFTWAMVGVALVVFLILEHQSQGSLLPNAWYCRIGAGQWVQQSNPSYSTHGDCLITRSRSCITSYNYSTYCQHSTIWNAIIGRGY
jgi:hypothetical protein